MNFKKITVAGSGILGYQIAFQSAFCGFNVTVYDINDEVLDKAKTKFASLSEAYTEDMQATQAQLDVTAGNLRYTSDLADAVKDADLVIEAIPENPKIKIDFYQKLGKVAPPKTIFVTNSSTLLPSQFAETTGRPEKYMAMHFANNIWKNNTAEIMRHSGTDPEVFDSVVSFAKDIRMVAIPIYKEQPGYIISSLLTPFLAAGLELLVKDVADYKAIDKAWMVGTKAPRGPFGMIDLAGANTVYNICKMNAEKSGDPLQQKVVDYLKENLIDKGKLGITTGEGFYTYPNPAYLSDDFLK